MNISSQFLEGSRGAKGERACFLAHICGENLRGCHTRQQKGTLIPEAETISIVSNP
jgi:hypothetical protein